jgi:DNA-binding response OmpR family regulator
VGWAGTRVLVAAEDAEHRRTLSAGLREQEMQVLEAASGLEALSQMRSAGVDVALVDLDLSEIGGLELIRRVRRESTVPIILLAPSGDETPGIAALEAGADDYLAGACSSDEVAARVRAVVRRAHAFREPTVFRSGELEIDLEARRCRRAGQEVPLTRREFDLLGALLRYEGRIHTRRQLLSLVWGDDGVSSKTVDVHVASLRRKLGPAIRISTLRGVGYRLDAAESPSQPVA